MQALMDTHTFLWWTLNDPALSPACRRIIANRANALYISVVSVWEIVIKAQTGRLPLPDPPAQFIPSRIAAGGFILMPVHMEHALQVSNLPLHHREPFDRILVAQAQIENLPILTVDSIIGQYAVSKTW